MIVNRWVSRLTVLGGVALGLLLPGAAAAQTYPMPLSEVDVLDRGIERGTGRDAEVVVVKPGPMEDTRSGEARSGDAQSRAAGLPVTAGDTGGLPVTGGDVVGLTVLGMGAVATGSVLVRRSRSRTRRA